MKASGWAAAILEGQTWYNLNLLVYNEAVEECRSVRDLIFTESVTTGFLPLLLLCIVVYKRNAT